VSEGGLRGRGNGLTAASYAPLVTVGANEVDPLLSALAAEGVAAYAALTGGPDDAGQVAGVGQAGEAVGARQPGEAGSVFVDSEQRPAARRVLGQALPVVAARLDEQEQEAAFAAIVAGWDTHAERSWPDAEDLASVVEPPSDPPDRPSAAPPATQPPAAPTVTPRFEAPPTAATTPPPHDDDDHYVAPPPPPLPPLRGSTVLIVVALVLGIGLLLAPTLVGLEHRTSLDVLGVGSIVGAVALLVSRMRPTSADDAPDDGAVV